MPEPAPAAATVALLGSTGFVGAAVAADLSRHGFRVRPVTAPRLRWPENRPHRPESVPPRWCPEIVEDLTGKLAGAAAVVNAAGIADGNAPSSPHLYGANALLPLLVARAAAAAGIDRYVHLSSAAVQGSGQLDETPHTTPFSPYSRSKALGEELVLAHPARGQVLFRSTWVHGSGRPNTESLVRLARSPLSCVAGAGTAPTPQVLVGDIAASVRYLVSTPHPVPPIALQPANGMTTGLLLRLLSNREPKHIPPALARTLVRNLRRYGRLGRRANAHSRRIDMLLFGRQQVPGWLAAQGVSPPLAPAKWQALGGAPIPMERV